MKKTLTFTTEIRAPRAAVFQKMLDAEGYKIWAAPFMEGSHFQGTWEKGSKMKFLAPNGDGMVAEIAENRRNEFVSIRHLGEISGGVEDTTSDKVSWAPTYENYTFTDKDGGTEVKVTLETLPAWEEYMSTTFPKALEVLKRICEQA